MDEEALRKEFERAACEDQRLPTISRLVWGGDYVFPYEFAWRMYQKADAAARRECAEVCKAVAVKHARESILRDDITEHERMEGAHECEAEILATIPEPKDD